MIDPFTEADQAAILTQLLASFGTCLGRTACLRIDQDVHYLNLFVAVVGATASSREGTSLGVVNRLFRKAVSNWDDYLVNGLQSGQGIIWHLRDKNEKGEPIDHPTQRQILCQETEFASVLAGVERDKSTLSAHLRQLWDGAPVLKNYGISHEATATGCHVSLIGHITAEELQRTLSPTQLQNGFANRFLWTYATNSKLLPFSGELTQAAEQEYQCIVSALQAAIAFARTQREIGVSQEAREHWQALYSELRKDKPGTEGFLQARAAPQVRRLAAIYAMLDQCTEAGPQHLGAGRAVWKHTEQSIAVIFPTPPATTRPTRSLRLCVPWPRLA